MMVLLLFASFSLWAQEPVYWSHLLKLSERHEFYKDNEIISAPKDSWQNLFSVSYIDRELNRLKDCVFFRVPGAEPGVFKLKTISALAKCDEHLLLPGDKEIQNVKSLQFAINETKVTVSLTFPDYRNEKWIGTFQGNFQKPLPKMGLSSSEYKSPKLILLAPRSDLKSASKAAFLKKGTLCHNINEDCEEVAPSTCAQCGEGWYEVPNGCAQGPKFCGRHVCGGKDQPACRRGMKWQRKDVPFECRIDSSFAYCSKGLSVQCDGKKAFCR